MIAQYRDAFLEELEEVLQTMDKEILLLERNSSSHEQVQALFRAAHTLKGSSAVMGLEPMTQLTHTMEQILDEVRNHKLEVTDTLINLLFSTIDMLKLMKAEIADHNQITIEVVELIDSIRVFLSVKAEEKNVEGNKENSGIDTAEELDDSYCIDIDLDPGCEMKMARAAVIHSTLTEIGQIIRFLPEINVEREDCEYEHIRVRLKSDLDQALVRQALVGLMDIKEVRVAITDRTRGARTAALPQAAVRATNDKNKNQTIRVNVDRIEHLMNTVGEIIIDQTRFRQLVHNLTAAVPDNQDLKALTEVSDHIHRIIGDMQESVMKIRMLPIENLFGRFPRMVRDLAQNLNKDIHLEILGQETELDRTLIEEIGDPLIHLIRNALDHGVETREERARAGKPKAGLVRITAAHEDNQIVITVEDDGAGIDPVKMRSSAVAKGLLSEEEADKLSDQEAIHLIFEPGFSTAVQLSDVSGRGVGMDIVRTNIQKLNGMIHVETNLGAGTAFKIKLPLTLAIITGLVTSIRSSNRIFIVPMTNVHEIVRVSTNEIKSVQGEAVVQIRDNILPVVWLHDLFHIPRSEESTARIPLVIVGVAEKKIALAVDSLLGNQEIVIKSLSSYLGKIEGVLGATILGNGQVALILEVAGLMKLSSSVR